MGIKPAFFINECRKIKRKRWRRRKKGKERKISSHSTPDSRFWIISQRNSQRIRSANIITGQIRSNDDWRSDQQASKQVRFIKFSTLFLYLYLIFFSTYYFHLWLQVFVRKLNHYETEIKTVDKSTSKCFNSDHQVKRRT